MIMYPLNRISTLIYNFQSTIETEYSSIIYLSNIRVYPKNFEVITNIESYIPRKNLIIRL